MDLLTSVSGGCSFGCACTGGIIIVSGIALGTDARTGACGRVIPNCDAIIDIREDCGCSNKSVFKEMHKIFSYHEAAGLKHSSSQASS